jgi:replicative DNA helicase
MITEAFLNVCFSVIFCRLPDGSKVRRDNTIPRDVLEVLDFFEDKDNTGMPVGARTKWDCLKRVCALKIEGRGNDSIISSLTGIGKKYSSLKDFLEAKADEELETHEVKRNIDHIRVHRKATSMFSNYNDLVKLVELIKDGSFEAIDDLVSNYEEDIKRLYVNVMEHSRSSDIEASASLDFIEDDHTPILEEIVDKYTSKNKVSTGFRVFDTDVMNGGFETERLYIFGGGTSAGKSTLMNNMIINSATIFDPVLDECPQTNEIERVYIYVTLENSLSDAYLRTYQPLFDRTTAQAVDDVKKGLDIKKAITGELGKKGSTIIMKFFPAYSITPNDLMPVVNDAISTYGQEAIKGLYVDYLDLLRPDRRHEFYRIELGHIALSLKGISSFYKIPVITASQLGRQVYDGINNARELNLGMISESIKKVEHADFVALLARNVEKESLVHVFVGKNRSGRSNVAINFVADFNKYKFINGNVAAVSKEERPESRIGTTPMDDVSFSGMTI